MGKLDDPKLEGKLLLLAGDFAITLLLTAGTALSVLSGYRLDADGGAAIAFCAAASAASAVLHSLSRPWWSLGAAAAIATVFWRMWEEILPVLQWIGQAMGLSSLYLVWSSRREEHLLPVFLLLCAALAWLMGWAAVRLRAWYLAALLALTPVLPAIQMGVLPAWGAMLAAFAGWGCLLLTSLFRREDPEGLGRAQLLSLTGMGALLMALVMSLPMEGYRRPQWATNARDNLAMGLHRQLERHFGAEALEGGLLADLGLDLSVPGQGPIGGSGNAAGSGSLSVLREDLLAAGPRQYSGKRILSVETDEPDCEGLIYLRGGSLGTYTGESWEPVDPAPGPDGVQPVLYPCLTAADTPPYTMTVQALSGLQAGFYPYRLAAWGVTDEAGRMEAQEEWTYSVSYLPGGPEDGFTPLTGSWAEEEAKYRRGSAGPYLSVPQTARQALAPLLDDIARQDGYADPAMPEAFHAALSAASQTAAALAERAVYDLNVPAMEPGEDFVSHFIEEGRGYCVHFATAGTLLLRMQGIPARYVSGYTVEMDAQGQGTALDSDAHAWVEIYLDGYGWHPVDMTPGYAGGESGVELTGSSGGEAPEDAGPPEEDSPEEELPPEEEPPGEEPPEDDESPDQALPSEEAPGQEETPEESFYSAEFWKGLAKALGGIAGAAGILGGAYALALLLRRQERESPDVNRSVIRAYRRYERVLRWGGAENETLETLGRKARFSQHTLTEEEREAAWRSLDEASESAQKGRKLLPRWLFALLRPLL